MEFIFFVAHFCSQTRGQSHEASGRNIVEASFFKFGFDPLKLLAQFLPPLAFGDEAILLYGLGLDDPEVLNLELMRATPIDESWLRDSERFGDFGEAVAFGAEGDELVNC